MINDKKLNDSELENAAGGLLFDATNIIGSDPDRKWEVLDNKNGNVLQRFRTEQEAKDWVKNTYGDNAINTATVDWNYVQALRSSPLA